MRKEVFVCDHCGARKRLPSAQRHWCEECHATPPVELRPVRDKKASLDRGVAAPVNSDRHRLSLGPR